MSHISYSISQALRKGGVCYFPLEFQRNQAMTEISGVDLTWKCFHEFCSTLRKCIVVFIFKNMHKMLCIEIIASARGSLKVKVIWQWPLLISKVDSADLTDKAGVSFLPQYSIYKPRKLGALSLFPNSERLFFGWNYMRSCTPC